VTRADLAATASSDRPNALFCPGYHAAMNWNKLADRLAVKPGADFRLDHIDPADTHGVEQEEGATQLSRNIKRLSVLQYLLYAEAKRAVLVVLQGIDAGGKDGTIRHVMTGLNPQGVRVTPFKVPDGVEKRHDYLWRVHKAVPEFGEIGIFNRSHYEELLVVRVHKLVRKAVWLQRYEQINDFEEMLASNGVRIVKFLLYISKEEQAERFRARLQKKTKMWKFSEADLKERTYWDDYMKAYDDMLRKCSTKHAPWYVIPANHKWFRNLAVSQVLVDAMEDMDMQYPTPVQDASQIQFE
jgi:PPK2 family polyphosphate:nucleotide phosphotransferase